MNKRKHVIAKDAKVVGVDYTPLDSDTEESGTLTWDIVESSGILNKDALEADTKVIYQLYLDGIITVHELDIMLQDLDSEYAKGKGEV